MNLNHGTLHSAKEKIYSYYENKTECARWE